MVQVQWGLLEFSFSTRYAPSNVVKGVLSSGCFPFITSMRSNSQIRLQRQMKFVAERNMSDPGSFTLTLFMLGFTRYSFDTFLLWIAFPVSLVCTQSHPSGFLVQPPSHFTFSISQLQSYLFLRIIHSFSWMIPLYPFLQRYPFHWTI